MKEAQTSAMSHNEDLRSRSERFERVFNVVQQGVPLLSLTSFFLFVRPW